VLSKRIGFEPDFFQQAIRRARRAGLDALAITNHFNTPDFESTYTYLDRRYPYLGASYDVEGIKLFPGMEVNVREGPHIVVIGERQHILDCYARLRHNMTEETYCSAHEFFDRKAELPLLTVLAHPFRPKREVTRLDTGIWSRFDALELNARDLFTLGRGVIPRVEGIAADSGLPVIAGSDAHHFCQLGTIYNEFASPLNSVAGLKSEIADGDYTIHISRMLEPRVAAARKAKATIKEAKLGTPPE
jgi:histidinol phosphatase-like PHP family hydrolase